MLVKTPQPVHLNFVDYYERHADSFGWGPGRNVVDPVRADALIRHAAGNTFLDLGCGAGAYVDLLSRRGFVGIGCDRTASFLERAVSRGYKGSFVCSDVMHLPFPDRYFDTVSLLTVLEHIPDDLAALNEAVRVAGKRLIVMVPLIEDEVLLEAGLCLKNRIDRSHVHYYSLGDIRSLLKQAGCSIVCQESVNKVALRYLIFRSLRLPTPAIWLARLALKLLPWKDYYNECIIVAERE